MALTRRQCRQMAQAAEENGARLHVNEQFFRREVLVLARRVIAAGAIGKVHRITFFHAHTGYHNNSVIQFFAGGVPATVSAFEHTMPLRRHLDGAGRWQECETFRLRVMHFAGGMLVTDAAANIKSALGRCPRPGYMEIDGTDGAIVEQPGEQPQPWEGRAEVRLVAEDDLLHGGYAESFPVQRVHFVGHQVEVSRRLPWNGHFHRLRVRLPGRTIEYENPMASRGLTDNYLSTVAQSTLDFCRGVRGGQREFTVEMAVASQDMEAACARSAARAGEPVALPLPPEETPEEQAGLAALGRRYGADPMDAEAMLDIAFPKNYVT
jgi:predicted dehydrogenase